MFNNLVFEKSFCLRDNVEKCCGAGRVTDGNIAHAHCMLDTYGYKHTLTIYNTLLFHFNNGCTKAIRTFSVLLKFQ
jgi:hypothetical protein